MRAGVGTILQTLTSEAASILKQSIAEAGRRNHGQTTPVHVAATLLASPAGFLRQACIKSHPNSSHPLQCRALELCFCVALDRLPTAQNTASVAEPPISNALMAALKRAQAHQRRGCPELQQQPLLAVKVELEQLITSILDDPSVSKIMREASFSSPAVKATIEQSLNSSPSAANPNRNPYLSPRLQQGIVPQPGQRRGEEVKRIVQILLGATKRNPVLVGESEPEAIVKELFRRIDKKELVEGSLEYAEIIQLASDNTQIPTKLEELEDLSVTRMADSNGRSVILDLGNLKWLIEQPAAVQRIRKLLMRFGGDGAGRIWLIGTATCETFLRCQVHHPSIENDWNLQVVPVAAKSPPSGLYPRIVKNGILGSSVESISSIKFLPSVPIPHRRQPSESLNVGTRLMCCPQCTQKYEQELQNCTEEFERSSSGVEMDSTLPPLPHWLQKAKAGSGDVKSIDQTQSKDRELMVKQKTQELQKKWNTRCLHLHPNFHGQNNFGSARNVQMGTLTTDLHSRNLLNCHPCQPSVELNKSLGRTLQLNTNPQSDKPADASVRTELVLGHGKLSGNVSEQTNKDGVKEILGSNYVPTGPEIKSLDIQSTKLLGVPEVDSYKKLLKVLMEKVWWQQDAASSLANTITQCKLGSKEFHGAGSKGDFWLLFGGPDKVGKKKMAAALAEQVSGSIPVTICLGTQHNDRGSDNYFRGRTPLDQISEAVRKNPFSVIVLEDIDEADGLFRGSIKRAIESGRLNDSHGREISLRNAIFILMTTWLPDHQRHTLSHNSLVEKELANLADGSWQLKLSVSEKLLKRRANWLCSEDRSVKNRKDTSSGLLFDLNEAADAEDATEDGSHNSSDLTIDHEDEYALSNTESTITSLAFGELLDSVDKAIVFKPVDFGHIRGDIENRINGKFSTIFGEGVSIKLEEQAAEKIFAGVWLGKTGLEEWLEKALVPSFRQCFPRIVGGIGDKSVVVTLEVDGESGNRSRGEWLPSNIKVVAAGVDGL